MDASLIITFTVLVPLLAVAALAVFPSVRYFLRKIQSEKWPTVPATIERHEVRPSGYNRYLMPLADRSLFNYKFALTANSYSGQFFIFADSYAAVQLQQELDGQIISVKYKPDNPDISVLASTWDPRYQGREASQDPHWLNAGGGSDIVTLNLKPRPTHKPPNPPET